MTDMQFLFSVYKIFEDDTPDAKMRRDLTWLQAKHFISSMYENDEYHYNIIEQEQKPKEE